MAKFNFNDYRKEIETISKVQNVDLGVAFDKFRADVRLGVPAEYNTGTAIPGFDFAGAKKAWNALTREEQHDAVNAYQI